MMVALGLISPLSSQPIIDWIGSLTFHNGGMLTAPKEAVSANGVLKVSLTVDAFRQVGLPFLKALALLDILIAMILYHFPGKLYLLYHARLLL